MTDKLNEYGFGFQVKVLAAMFTDRTFLQQIADIIQAEYFESEANNNQQSNGYSNFDTFDKKMLANKFFELNA